LRLKHRLTGYFRRLEPSQSSSFSMAADQVAAFIGGGKKADSSDLRLLGRRESPFVGRTISLKLPTTGPAFELRERLPELPARARRRVDG
jgi:hypothetical protein